MNQDEILQEGRELLDESRAIFDVPLFEISGTTVTLATVITFVVVVALAFFVSWVLQRALARALALRGVSQPGTVGITRRLLHYAILAVGVGIALDTVGIDLAALFAAGAIFAVAIGFAMQNIAQNFVSGVILLVERTIKPGDILRVEDRVVRVLRMGIRATVARTWDEEDLIIPNATLVQSTVTNFTMADTLYRLRTTVGVTYGSDLELVRRTLEATLAGLSWRNAVQEPRVLLKGFGSSSVDYDVSVWIEDPWLTPRRRSEMNEAIWWAFKREGITIAFPQLDVHFDRGVEQTLARLGGVERNGAERSGSAEVARSQELPRS